MSTIVVDASVAAKWFAPDEEYSESACRWLEQPPRLHAPDFLHLELDNLFCKWARRGAITVSEAEEMRLTLRKQSIVLYPFDEVEAHAFDLANATGRALYDCLYLALAILIDGVMVTADRRFYDDLAATPMGGRVHWVTEAPAP